MSAHPPPVAPPIYGITPGAGTLVGVGSTNGPTEELSITAAAQHLSQTPHAVTFAADLTDFGRWLDGVQAGAGRSDTVRRLGDLARSGRLLCLRTARELVEASTSNWINWDNGSHSVSVARDGLMAMGYLAVLRPIGVPHAGPRGLYVRSRARLALGLVHAGTLRPAPDAVTSTLARLDEFERKAFWSLTDPPQSNAANIFKGGRRSVRDSNGGRSTSDRPLREWVTRSRERLLDRHGVPAYATGDDARPGIGNKACDPRCWPAQDFASDPLVQFWRLNVSGRLWGQIGWATRPENVVAPKYTIGPSIRCEGTDLFSYARLRATTPELRAFQARSGRRLIRVGLEELLVTALRAQLASAPRGGLSRVEGIDDRDLGRMVSAIATGLDTNGAQNLASGWYGTPPILQDAWRRFDAALLHAWPELASWVSDAVLTSVAKCYEVDPADLAFVTGYQAASGAGFAPHLVGTGLAGLLTEREYSPAWDAKRSMIQAHCRSRNPLPAEHPQDLTARRLERLAWLWRDGQEVRTATGRYRQGVPWVTSRCAFLEMAEDLLTECVFELTAAGLVVVAVGPEEVVLAAEGDGSGVATRIELAVGNAVTAYTFGDMVTPTIEDLELW